MQTLTLILNLRSWSQLVFRDTCKVYVVHRCTLARDIAGPRLSQVSASASAAYVKAHAFRDHYIPEDFLMRRVRQDPSEASREIGRARVSQRRVPPRWSVVSSPSRGARQRDRHGILS